MTRFYCDRHFQVLGRMKEVEQPKYVIRDLTDPRKEMLLCDECMADLSRWFQNKEVMSKTDEIDKREFLKNLENFKFDSVNKPNDENCELGVIK